MMEPCGPRKNFNNFLTVPLIRIGSSSRIHHWKPSIYDRGSVGTMRLTVDPHPRCSTAWPLGRTLGGKGFGPVRRRSSTLLKVSVYSKCVVVLWVRYPCSFLDVHFIFISVLIWISRLRLQLLASKFDMLPDLPLVRCLPFAQRSAKFGWKGYAVLPRPFQVRASPLT